MQSADSRLASGGPPVRKARVIELDDCPSENEIVGFLEIKTEVLKEGAGPTPRSGDYVLIHTAGALSDGDLVTLIAEPHVVGRFGGEEFVVVLPETDQESARALIERARAALSQRHFRVRDTDEPIGQVTFSAGIAATDCDPQQALREADALLYEAKRAGRNRTICKLAA